MHKEQNNMTVGICLWLGLTLVYGVVGEFITPGQPILRRTLHLNFSNYEFAFNPKSTNESSNLRKSFGPQTIVLDDTDDGFSIFLKMNVTDYYDIFFNDTRFFRITTKDSENSIEFTQGFNNSFEFKVRKENEIVCNHDDNNVLYFERTESQQWCDCYVDTCPHNCVGLPWDLKPRDTWGVQSVVFRHDSKKNQTRVKIGSTEGVYYCSQSFSNKVFEQVDIGYDNYTIPGLYIYNKMMDDCQMQNILDRILVEKYDENLVCPGGQYWRANRCFPCPLGTTSVSDAQGVDQCQCSGNALRQELTFKPIYHMGRQKLPPDDPSTPYPLKTFDTQYRLKWYNGVTVITKVQFDDLSGEKVLLDLILTADANAAEGLRITRKDRHIHFSLHDKQKNLQCSSESVIREGFYISTKKAYDISFTWEKETHIVVYNVGGVFVKQDCNDRSDFKHYYASDQYFRRIQVGTINDDLGTSDDDSSYENSKIKATIYALYVYNGLLSSDHISQVLNSIDIQKERFDDDYSDRIVECRACPVNTQLSEEEKCVCIPGTFEDTHLVLHYTFDDYPMVQNAVIRNSGSLSSPGDGKLRYTSAFDPFSFDTEPFLKSSPGRVFKARFHNIETLYNGFIEIPFAALKKEVNQSWTVSFWTQIDNYVASATEIVLLDSEKKNQGAKTGCLVIYHKNNQLFFQIKSSTDAINSQVDFPKNDGKTRHVVFTVQCVDKWVQTRIYINGSLSHQTQDNLESKFLQLAINDTETLEISQNMGNTSLEDFRMYTRALAENEIRAMYYNKDKHPGLCQPCPANASSVVDSKSFYDCTPHSCPAGEYSTPEGCQSCPYSTTSGESSTSIRDCTCKEGFYHGSYHEMLPDSNMSEGLGVPLCIPCPRGSTSGFNASSRQECSCENPSDNLNFNHLENLTYSEIDFNGVRHQEDFTGLNDMSFTILMQVNLSKTSAITANNEMSLLYLKSGVISTEAKIVAHFTDPTGEGNVEIGFESLFACVNDKIRVWHEDGIAIMLQYISPDYLHFWVNGKFVSKNCIAPPKNSNWTLIVGYDDNPNENQWIAKITSVYLYEKPLTWQQVQSVWNNIAPWQPKSDQSIIACRQCPTEIDESEDRDISLFYLDDQCPCPENYYETPLFVTPIFSSDDVNPQNDVPSAVDNQRVYFDANEGFTILSKFTFQGLNSNRRSLTDMTLTLGDNTEQTKQTLIEMLNEQSSSTAQSIIEIYHDSAPGMGLYMKFHLDTYETSIQYESEEAILGPWKLHAGHNYTLSMKFEIRDSADSKAVLLTGYVNGAKEEKHFIQWSEQAVNDLRLALCRKKVLISGHQNPPTYRDVYECDHRFWKISLAQSSENSNTWPGYIHGIRAYDMPLSSYHQQKILQGIHGVKPAQRVSICKTCGKHDPCSCDLGYFKDDSLILHYQFDDTILYATNDSTAVNSGSLAKNGNGKYRRDIIDDKYDRVFWVKIENGTEFDKMAHFLYTVENLHGYVGDNPYEVTGSVNSRIEIPALVLNEMQNFSISCWIEKQSSGQNDNYIVRSTDANNNDIFYIDYEAASKTGTFAVFKNSLEIKLTYSADERHGHFVFTFAQDLQGTSTRMTTIEMFYNGVSNNKKSNPVDVFSISGRDNASFTIGPDLRGVKLQDFRIYNRVLLQHEIKLLYDKKNISDGLCAECPFSATDSMSETEKNAECFAGDHSHRTCKADEFHNGTACTECPVGKTSPAHSITQEACVFPAQDFNTCAAGEYYNGEKCVSCPEARTSEFGTTSIDGCVCAAGWFNAEFEANFAVEQNYTAAMGEEDKIKLYETQMELGHIGQMKKNMGLTFVSKVKADMPSDLTKRFALFEAEQEEGINIYVYAEPWCNELEVLLYFEPKRGGIDEDRCSTRLRFPFNTTFGFHLRYDMRKQIMRIGVDEDTSTKFCFSESFEEEFNLEDDEHYPMTWRFGSGQGMRDREVPIDDLGPTTGAMHGFQVYSRYLSDEETRAAVDRIQLYNETAAPSRYCQKCPIGKTSVKDSTECVPAPNMKPDKLDDLIIHYKFDDYFGDYSVKNSGSLGSKFNANYTVNHLDSAAKAYQWLTLEKGDPFLHAVKINTDTKDAYIESNECFIDKLNGEFSISFWFDFVKDPAVTASLFRVSKPSEYADITGIQGIVIAREKSPDVLIFKLKKKATLDYTNTIEFASIAGNLHHLVFMVTQDQFQIFVDGKIKLQQPQREDYRAINFTCNSDTQNMRIGIRMGAKNSLQDFRIYNRSLRDSEVEQLYNLKEREFGGLTKCPYMQIYNPDDDKCDCPNNMKIPASQSNLCSDDEVSCKYKRPGNDDFIAFNGQKNHTDITGTIVIDLGDVKEVGEVKFSFTGDWPNSEKNLIVSETVSEDVTSQTTARTHTCKYTRSGDIAKFNCKKEPARFLHLIVGEDDQANFNIIASDIQGKKFCEECQEKDDESSCNSDAISDFKLNTVNCSCLQHSNSHDKCFNSSICSKVLLENSFHDETSHVILGDYDKEYVQFKPASDLDNREYTFTVPVETRADVLLLDQYKYIMMFNITLHGSYKMTIGKEKSFIQDSQNVAFSTVNGNEYSNKSNFNFLGFTTNYDSQRAIIQYFPFNCLMAGSDVTISIFISIGDVADNEIDENMKSQFQMSIGKLLSLDFIDTIQVIKSMDSNRVEQQKEVNIEFELKYIQEDKKTEITQKTAKIGREIVEVMENNKLTPCACRVSCYLDNVLLKSSACEQ